MRPVDQTRFGKGEGNCFAASLASITELPLDVVERAVGRVASDEHWYDAACRGMRELGWELSYDTSVAPDGYCVMSGPAPRGLLHSVVALNGEMVHDPHPSRAGLLEITDYIVARRVAPECLQLTAGQFTRDDLITRGVKPEAADELVAYSDALLARAAARATPAGGTEP